CFGVGGADRNREQEQKSARDHSERRADDERWFRRRARSGVDHVTSARRFSSVLRQSWKLVEKEATPSRSSVAVTSSKSTRASPRLRITRSASATPSSTASARRFASPLWSASIDAGARVLTVSRPTRSST